MTKDELKAKREQFDGYLNELFMLWQVAGDDQLPANKQYDILKVAELKKNQVEALLSELFRGAEKDFETRRNKAYENRN